MSLLSDEVYKQLYVTGSGPGILYGLPKIHKSNFATDFPLRPIFAAYNTASYKLSKFLVPILAPFTTNEYTATNSFSFVNDVSKVHNADSFHMVSFDVENLFTNIPLHETINICLQYLFPNVISTVLGLSRDLFRKLLELSVLNSFFMFNSKLYKQTEGLGMGLCLGPTFANIFLCYHERAWLTDCPENFRPSFYKRYVDDTFLLFRQADHAALFLDYLNSKHPNIKFTCEHESSGSLSFLDVNVSRSCNKFTTSVFRKSTFTGLGTSFFSYCTYLFKINAIKTLLYRAYHISSSYFILDIEFNFLRQYFAKNGYPLGLVNSHIKKFLAKKYESFDQHDSPPTEHHYISLPFFGPQSEKLKIELNSILVKFFPSISFRIILVNSNKIGSFFRYKDSLPVASRSSVIYQFTCPRCGDQYVGSTRRMLSVRCSEHAARSHRTGRRLAVEPHSAVRQHCEQACDAPVSIDSFKVIDYDKNSVSLLILESLYIFKNKPVLNDVNSAFPLNIVK